VFELRVRSRAARKPRDRDSAANDSTRSRPRHLGIWRKNVRIGMKVRDGTNGGQLNMPDKETLERARQNLKEGKSPSTAAGEFVRQEIDHVREGKHGVRSPKQAIAIGLSEARRAGIPLKPPAAGKTNSSTKKKAEHDYRHGQTSPSTQDEGSTPRRKARMKAMKREPKNSVSRAALSRQARSAATRRKASASQ